MDPNLAKCAITCNPNKEKLKPTLFKAYGQAQIVTYKGKQYFILTPTEPYTHLGIQLVPSLK